MLSRLLLSPLFFASVLLLALWRGRRWPRGVRRMLGVGVAVCVLLSMPLGADPLLHVLEHAAETTCAAPLPRAVVVLGGGVREDAAANEVTALSAASLRRVIAAVALWQRQGASLPFVISGGNVYGGPAEATLMADLALRFGVTPASLRVETDSRTTWQNAQHLATLVPAVPRRVWLVTSAAHLPRAAWTLRHFGFAPCAVPVDQRAVWPRGWRDVLPSTTAITHTEIALHELAGLAWYRLRALWTVVPDRSQGASAANTGAVVGRTPRHSA